MNHKFGWRYFQKKQNEVVDLPLTLAEWVVGGVLAFIVYCLVTLVATV